MGWRRGFSERRTPGLEQGPVSVLSLFIPLCLGSEFRADGAPNVPICDVMVYSVCCTYQ